MQVKNEQNSSAITSVSKIFSPFIFKPVEIFSLPVFVGRIRFIWFQKSLGQLMFSPRTDLVYLALPFRIMNSDIKLGSVVMASFDVTSLFTNIPVDETIEIISNHIFANCMYFEGFNCPQFIKLLSLCVKNCHFTFTGGRIYQQIEGVAMGSPLAPLP